MLNDKVQLLVLQKPFKMNYWVNLFGRALAQLSSHVAQNE